MSTTTKPHRRHRYTEIRSYKIRTDLPLGVFQANRSKGYFAQLNDKGQTVYLGTYPTIEGASEAYLRARAEADGPKDAA